LLLSASMTSRFANDEAVNVPTPIIRGLVSYDAWLLEFDAMDRDDL